jgi:hypothetical protein
MLPINSGNNLPCTPVSSNCVIWQGPDITCINLCNGDTVSDVIAKLATELCTLITQTCTCNPDLSTLTLGCIPAPTAATPTFLDYMQSIVNFICSLQTSTSTTKNVNLPRCLYYNDSLGNPVTSLPQTEFSSLLANQICLLVNRVTNIENTINDHAARLLILENCVLPCQAQGSFAPISVVSASLFPGASVELSTLVLAVETQFAQLRSAVGTLSMIGNALSTQNISGSANRLSKSGTYAADAKWINTPSTLAHSEQDQWVVLNDLYSAVKDLQSVVDVGCDTASFGFSYNIIGTSTGLATTLNMNFTSSNIPAGFSDCGGATTVKITDSSGTSVTQNVNVTNLQNSPAGINIPLTSLNVLNSITVEVPFCVSDGTSQCREVQTQIVPLSVPCITNLSVGSLTQTSAVVSFVNVADVQIKIELIDTNTLAVAATKLLPTPGSNVSETFTGLAQGTNYTVQVTMTSNGIPKTCPSITFTTLGVVCTDVRIITTGAAGSNDIYLGYHKNTPTTQIDYHYNPDTQKIVIGASGAVACHAPTVVFNSMNTATGEINVTMSYGAVVGTSITLESSSDGMTFSNPSVGADGVRVYATGITINTVYVRAFVTCSSTSTSEYLLFRYDFGTETFLLISSPEQCTYDESITASCPMGVEVAQQYLSCNSASYSVFSGGADSYWYYIGKYNRSGATVYLYAGWTQASAPTTVVECCACPAFILSDSIRVLCQEGNTASITIPYVIGEGKPTIVTQSLTTNGTLAQSATYSNQFTYTHVNTGNSYADTFQVKLSAITSGDCSTAITTVQIQIIPCTIKLVHKDQPIFAFIDTGSFTVAQATDIKDGLAALVTQWGTDFSYTGTLYFIPVIDNRWLGYQKAIVDNGTSANLDPAAGWVALRSLPATWSGGYGPPVYKQAALLLAFSNNASGDYHDSTLAAGFGSGVTAQPRTDYLDDYDAYHDSLNGTLTSAWGKALPIRNAQFPDGFSLIHYPLTGQNSVSGDAAQVLQSLAAYTGEMIPAGEYGIQTAVDVTGYLLQGLVPSATNPYQGATTSGGNTLQPLYKKNCLVFVDNVIKTNTFVQIGDDKNDQFLQQMQEVVKSCSNTYPTTNAATVRYSSFSCSDGSTKIINRTGVAPSPSPYYEINKTYLSPAASNSTGADFYFTVTGYTTAAATVDVSAASLSAGCEASGTIFLVQDCTTGDQYKVDMNPIAGIDIGEVYKLTNTGATFTPAAPRAAWENAQVRCVSIVSLATGAEITSVTSSAVYASCLSCTP